MVRQSDRCEGVRELAPATRSAAFEKKVSCPDDHASPYCIRVPPSSSVGEGDHEIILQKVESSEELLDGEGGIDVPFWHGVR